MKTVALHNLGCKVNAYETEAMKQLLQEAGYHPVSFQEGADIYIINTCTVTNIADRKSRQMLHKAKKQNPDAVVVACGCYVQTEKGEKDACIDILVGNNQKIEIVEILKAYEKERKENQIEEMGESPYEDLQIESAKCQTRAYIKIQDGCNQFCSYCIIPYARGRIRSREREKIKEEAERLAKLGTKEIVLTGIHLSSYGVDTGDSLLELLKVLEEVEGLHRIRLGSLEPRVITQAFVEGISKLQKICPHFHLSLQSGSNSVLKRMNRKYTTQEYKASCELLRTYYENPAITTDIIVGFPGETEEEFLESKGFVEEIGFYETHIFKYSKREGTKAATMENQVEDSVKNKRSKEMISLGLRQKQVYESGFLGKKKEVLIEETIEWEGRRLQVGHTKEYIKIGIEEEEDKTNQLVVVEIRDWNQIIH